MDLDDKQKKFVDQYLITFNIEGSAISAGYPRDNALSIGIDLLNNDVIQKALKEREKALENIQFAMKLDKNKLLTTMYFQYNQAMKRQDIKTATYILEKIAGWCGLKPDEVTVAPANLIINNLDESKI